MNLSWSFDDQTSLQISQLGKDSLIRWYSKAALLSKLEFDSSSCCNFEEMMQLHYMELLKTSNKSRSWTISCKVWELVLLLPKFCSIRPPFMQSILYSCKVSYNTGLFIQLMHSLHHFTYLQDSSILSGNNQNLATLTHSMDCWLSNSSHIISLNLQAVMLTNGHSWPSCLKPRTTYIYKDFFLHPRKQKGSSLVDPT